MKINTQHVTVVVVAGVLVVVVAARPAWLSDSNEFLRNFVNHEYLNVLGVILAITLASLSQAHLTLNRIEEQRGYEFLGETRREIKEAAFWLIALFVAGFIIALAKPLACTSETSTAIANALAIFILTMYVLILVDITMAVFDLKANIHHDDKPSESDPDGQP
jgi:hypothetical protein